MNRKKITWRFSPPEDFPCHICGEGRAVVMAKIPFKAVTLNLTLCELCSEKSDDELSKIIEEER